MKLYFLCLNVIAFAMTGYCNTQNSTASKSQLKELSKLCSNSLKAYTTINALKERNRELLGPLPKERQEISNAIHYISITTPMTEESLKQLDFSIKVGNSSTVIKERQKHQFKKELGTIQAEKSRDIFVATLQKKEIQIKEEIDKIVEPNNKKIAAVKTEILTHNNLLKSRLEKYFTSTTNAKSAKIKPQIDKAFIYNSWYDQNGKKIAVAHVRMRSNEERISNSSEKLLLGKYPIKILKHPSRKKSHNYVWFWTGNFLIYFYSEDKLYQTENTLIPLLVKCIDLEGLSKINIATVD
ncbi:hypothetical protein LNTAR_18465 [Lentisphaera araneosa HTCC2155]|uniref:Uncharacterized protein n=1 Tax=Lentisphaera araneosa HTCC2155 TaxID=313628 RepID=A6DNJ9_9BACT|nr:hypothetical protein [Lentisphaera araneosa]EDM26658.1 hypothetical protein LNTAR_18465 [Lentisphaera araneosa HTCC2155]